ncbi:MULTISPECIES: cytochrome o ubiquinol oxidase subunit IV [Caballeronia]|jgi:cytochrome o ubiquinol oxidase operon protein cyoD|uniref:Cytochrome bo(3) ubiquinol oxidase subunit 4 n=1 Tax=Caballeronia zhejiangensis TaxID=871203 RepID=A0A656QGG5_9BURK|nr:MULTISPECIES: cytochrome o ubiquinol oxidase subunit IV [Caballeronia]EKS70489.1 ubiquinol oxidase subunit IV [Burkholderia sp. SJ98]KDR28978.1 cytochrome C oxidase subunit III [Caballeronia zhejiangensis]MCG7401828.1 cytochrome o ubiquinol oxidase subunit IV [Caballeronia zhejiangensis]MCI1046073.1 cytochrome o ubiquinol oxidase subunit IV [Caballeronia zhejiangensis]MDR5767936.1 cytochrome o ubiquinol oxidase subunit IV [Caballeronia sp. LZ028]
MAHAHTETSDFPHVTVRGYLIGFVLAVVLTVASFWAATSGAFKGESAIVALAVLAAVQVIVHVVFFLHVNSSKGQRWHAISFAYTILMSLILIVGTVWVMHNVHMLMMAR